LFALEVVEMVILLAVSQVKAVAVVRLHIETISR
jgi:hypothetical protein